MSHSCHIHLYSIFNYLSDVSCRTVCHIFFFIIIYIQEYELYILHCQYYVMIIHAMEYDYIIMYSNIFTITNVVFAFMIVFNKLWSLVT